LTDEEKAELRWRLNTLRVAFEEGKIHIAEHIADDFKTSLLAMKYGPDGEIDLETVDGRIRSMALMAAHFHNRTETKNAISLEDISKSYFEFISANLGYIKDKFDETDVTADQFARNVTRNPEAVESFHRSIPEFLEALGEFWDSVSESAEYHIQDMQTSKAVFGGDLFPSVERNIASSLGLYVDTIILADPFWHSKSILETYPPETAVYYLIKHSINVMQYKQLATADLACPIVTILPFRSSINDDEAEMVMNLANADALAHASSVFNKNFNSKEELFEFIGPLASPEDVAAQVNDSNRLLFDTEWHDPVVDQIRKSLDVHWGDATNGNAHAGQMVASSCFGRMRQATDLLMKSRYLGATPLIDAPTSWQYFNWKLEYNAANSLENQGPMQIQKGLQFAASADEPWLNKIPPAALIEMRKTGAFAEIRETITRGVKEVSTAHPDNFYRVGDHMVDNIRTAFDAHQKQVAELQGRSIRFAGHDVGAMLAAGAVDLTSIVVGTPTFGAASFMVNQLVDAPKLKEIPSKYRELRDAHRELRKSPMGLFFRHKN